MKIPSYMDTKMRKHLHRAAVRAFGKCYKITITGKVRADGRVWTYRLETGRFYCLNFSGVI